MDWTQSLTVMAVTIALFGLFASWFIWAFNKIDSDIKALSQKLDHDIQQQTARIDQQSARMDQQNARIDQQNARSDQLYQIIIDLMKQNNPKTNP